MAERLVMPPGLTTDAQKLEWLERFRERLRRWNNARVAVLAVSDSPAAAKRWNLENFRPRNSLLTEALLPIRDRLHPPNPDDDEDTPDPRAEQKRSVRALRDDDAKLDIDPDAIFQPRIAPRI